MQIIHVNSVSHLFAVLLELYTLFTFLFTHKAIHSSDFPEYLSLELRNVHTHNLRSSEAPLLLVPKETGTFQHSAASIFNKLPSALRNIKDYNSFCHSLKKYLSNRVK